PGQDHAGAMTRFYDKVLTWALKHRLKTIGIALAAFILSLFPILLLSTSLIGDVDRGKVLLEVELQPGSKIEDTHRVVDKLSAILNARPEVDSVFAMMGIGGSEGPSGVNTARLFISLKPRNQRRLTQKQFEDSVRPELLQVPGARLGFSRAAG